jgi:hypothetical protein
LLNLLCFARRCNLFLLLGTSQDNGKHKKLPAKGRQFFSFLPPGFSTPYPLFYSGMFYRLHYMVFCANEKTPP